MTTLRRPPRWIDAKPFVVWSLRRKQAAVSDEDRKPALKLRLTQEPWQVGWWIQIEAAVVCRRRHQSEKALGSFVLLTEPAP
jgi:hypothetical protein